MSDASTTQPLSADAQETAGHGRHRGQVSAQDGDTAPAGGTARPAEDKAEAAA